MCDKKRPSPLLVTVDANDMGFFALENIMRRFGIEENFNSRSAMLDYLRKHLGTFCKECGSHYKGRCLLCEIWKERNNKQEMHK